MKLFGVFLIHIFLFPFICGAQEECVASFKHGEKISYDAYYNWHFIWLKSGAVQFELQRTNDNFKITATGKTLKAYDLIYKVRNSFSSTSNLNSFSPIEFQRSMKHGKNYSERIYKMDTQQKNIYSTILKGKNPPNYDTISYQQQFFDMLGAAYYFRTLDFENYEIGQLFPFKLLVDNSIEELHYRYLGQEAIKTRNRMTFRCHKISILLMKGDFFPEGENMFVWITTDKNRIPVMVETKLNVGYVKAMLNECEGTKYPLVMEKLK